MIQASFKKHIITAQGHKTLDVDFCLRPSELCALFGASGAGKTTVLRVLAGLTNPDEGSVTSNGQVWFDHGRHVNLPPAKRSVGFVFQEYNLFPHMSLRENLYFALPRGEDPGIVKKFLELVSLTGVAHLKPGVLSGGQKQRAALVRALLRRPQVLLLDEPFAALDWPMRLGLQEEILKIHASFQVPTLLVTHDAADVVRMCQRVLMLEDGRIVRQAAPVEVFGKNYGR